MISVGTILHDTYRIDSELGRGGMGRVFAASHTRLPRRFAVKVLMQAADGQSLKRFRREAEICSAIGHRNIVEVFDFNEVDGQPYIVMELLDGHSLRQRFEQEPVLPRALLLQLVQEVGRALSAAHGAGVIHRDLKPENIFVCREDDGTEQFKVLDFGISKIMGALSLQTREDMLLGTPGYMSPEQARGDVQHVTAKADQFSLAAILYEALSGQQAFVAAEDTPYTVLYKIVHRDPPPLFGQPPEVQKALARALAKQPDDRFDDVGQLVDAMVSALHKIPATVVQGRPSLPAQRATGRVWLLPLALGGAVLGATGTAAVVYRVREHRPPPQTQPAPTATPEQKPAATTQVQREAARPQEPPTARPQEPAVPSANTALAPTNAAPATLPAPTTPTPTPAAPTPPAADTGSAASSHALKTQKVRPPRGAAHATSSPGKSGTPGKAPATPPAKAAATPPPAKAPTVTAPAQPQPQPSPPAPAKPAPAADDELSNPYVK